MFLLREVLPAALAAYTAGVLGLLLGRAGWWAPWALAVAYGLGSLALSGWPALLPREALDWLVPLAFGAAAASNGCVWLHRRFSRRQETSVAPLFAPTLVAFGLAWNLAILAVLVREFVTERPRPLRAWPAISTATLLITGLAASGAILLSGSLRLGELTLVALATACAGATLFRRVERRALLVPVALLATLVVFAFRYAELPGWSAVWLGLGLNAGLWRRWQVPPEKSFTRADVLELAEASLCGVAATGMAFLHSPPLDY